MACCLDNMIRCAVEYCTVFLSRCFALGVMCCAAVCQPRQGYQGGWHKGSGGVSGHWSAAGGAGCAGTDVKVRKALPAGAARQWGCKGVVMGIRGGGLGVPFHWSAAGGAGCAGADVKVSRHAGFSQTQTFLRLEGPWLAPSRLLTSTKKGVLGLK
jgi:hypothetical protein